MLPVKAVTASAILSDLLRASFSADLLSSSALIFRSTTWPIPRLSRRIDAVISGMD
jgi:hypothetical protein